ncbi:MAG TPA: Ppx/GppA phosphatase family protein [Nitrospiria bacterium]|nr:Ppx/GppA phosphatase family protein [Nitrospiria bacterium]
MILAGIDIGTNTLRLLVAENREGGWRELYSDRKITRLGEGFHEKRRLVPSAINRSVEALCRFREALDRFSSPEIMAVATSAVREAENRQEFLDRARREAGFEIRVISGEEEARLTALGIQEAIPPGAGFQVLMDIGGGSTEWILTRGREILVRLSLPLGVVHLTETFLRSDPPDAGELMAMKARVLECLPSVKTALAPFLESKEAVWIGTAGTVTTLAAMAQELETYTFEKINRFYLSQEKIAALYRKVISIRREARTGLKGLEPGREDLIVAGTFFLLETLLYFNVRGMTVSEYGLREGIIVDLLRRRP